MENREATANATVTELTREVERLSNEELHRIVSQAFGSFGKPVTCEVVDPDLPEVVKLTMDGFQVLACVKGVTKGGASRPDDELRIQQLPKYGNYCCEHSTEVNAAVQLGVYKSGEVVIICAWKLSESTSESYISKQIKLGTVQKAWNDGFAQQPRNSEFVCAFRPEFIYFYVNSYQTLHAGDVSSSASGQNAGAGFRNGQSGSTIDYRSGFESEYARNRIFFGAPGTGKSYTINSQKNALLDGNEDDYERVTFHPDYTYAGFVGTYKPVPYVDTNGNDAITYTYVPGPFMRTYVKALKYIANGEAKPILLIIEEINRANVAAVFGDIFQLLDRNDDEISEYPIQTSEDMRKFLHAELGGELDSYNTIRIPDNMFIWATMNSADQGVFPMDTAFKRRWDFTYLGIDDSESGISGISFRLGQGEFERTVQWNELRKAINDELLSYRVNEDKLMGPYFISKKYLGTNEQPAQDSFVRVFKNKVIMYLFDDAAKQKRATLFAGCEERAKTQYSKICAEFDRKGVFIFCDAISSKFISKFIRSTPEDDG